MGTKFSRRINTGSNDETKLTMRNSFSDAELRGLAHLFKQKFPAGCISRGEFSVYYEEQFPDDGPAFAEHVFNAIDEDGNGYILFDEFAFFVHIVKQGTLEEKLRWLFRLYCRNKTTKEEITKEQIIETLLAIYGHKVNDAKTVAQRNCAELMSKMDVDGNGSLSENEFTEIAMSGDSANVIAIMLGQKRYV